MFPLVVLLFTLFIKNEIHKEKLEEDLEGKVYDVYETQKNQKSTEGKYIYLPIENELYIESLNYLHGIKSIEVMYLNILNEFLLNGVSPNETKFTKKLLTLLSEDNFDF